MSFDDGLSKKMRQAGAPRTPDGKLSSDNGLVGGLMIGTVMDDQDEQRAGRIWVSVPGITSRQVNSPNVEPHWRGTVPDRRSGRLEFDQELRRNWILCQPMFASMGSDMNRADFTVDGRNSTRGDVNSYGDWSQPRIGDYVTVMFIGGDPNLAVYTGCIGKPNQGRMIPGNAGYNSKTIVDGVEEKEKTKPSVAIPGYDNDFGSSTVTDKTGKVVDREDQNGKLPDHTAGKTAILSGVAYDKHRGPGTSSMKRESPSYVRGTKSAGWNYETEKYNTNQDGGQFTERSGKYRYINTTGHQFVIDDRPDHQIVRLRTSGGTQILMNDSADHPYMYISTSKGNVWMEFTDEGKIRMYSEDGFSLHSKDVNITSDRDINMEAFNDINLIARKNFRMTVGEETHWAFNGPFKSIYAKRADVTFLDDFFQNIEKSCHSIISKDHFVKIDGNQNTTVGKAFSLKSDDALYFESQDLMSLEADTLYMNSGMLADSEEAETAKKPKFNELKKKDATPVKEEIFQNKAPPKVKYLAPEVPQHQPWSGREGKSTSGTTGRVSPTENTNFTQTQPGSAFGATSSVDGNAFDQRRAGAACSYSDAPDDTMGAQMGTWTESNLNVSNLAIFSAGLFNSTFLTQQARNPASTGIWIPEESYASDNIHEQPRMKIQRWLKPGEIAPVDSYKCSQEIKDYIRGNEKLMQFPEVVDDSLFIGRGHEIMIGETFDGVMITAEIYKNWIAGGVVSTMVSLTSTEADTLFETDLARYEAFIRSSVTVYLTQGQYDALVSFAFHDQALNNPRGSTINVISAINIGRNDIALELMSQNVYVDGFIEENIVARRQQERNIFNTLPNDNMDYDGTEWGPADPSAITTLGDFRVYTEVVDAIDAAATAQSVNPKFMYVLCAQESGFSPNALNTAGGQIGLFQFPTDAAILYDILGEEYNHVENSLAAAKYIKDSKEAFLEVNEVEATDSDLYMCMFLGQMGGAEYVQAMLEDPDGSAVTTVNGLIPGLVDAVPTIFKKYDGTERTNQQVYDILTNLVSVRLSLF